MSTCFVETKAYPSDKFMVDAIFSYDRKSQWNRTQLTAAVYISYNRLFINFLIFIRIYFPSTGTLTVSSERGKTRRRKRLEIRKEGSDEYTIHVASSVLGYILLINVRYAIFFRMLRMSK